MGEMTPLETLADVVLADPHVAAQHFSIEADAQGLALVVGDTGNGVHTGTKHVHRGERAVLCLRAYKKLPQLYDGSMLVTTLDQPQAGVQGRFDAQGVSFANAQKLGRHYLEAYGWVR